jgi:hypothetical protein
VVVQVCVWAVVNSSGVVSTLSSAAAAARRCCRVLCRCCHPLPLLLLAFVGLRWPATALCWPLLVCGSLLAFVGLCWPVTALRWPVWVCRGSVVGVVGVVVVSKPIYMLAEV